MYNAPNQIEELGHVPGIGSICKIYATIDNAHYIFGHKGGEVISARDTVEANISLGVENPAFQHHLIKEGILKVGGPNPQTFILKDSLLFKHPVKPMDDRRQGGMYFVPEKVAREIMDRAYEGDDSIFIVPKNSPRGSVPFEEAENHEVFRWLFGDMVSRLGELSQPFYKNARIYTGGDRVDSKTPYFACQLGMAGTSVSPSMRWWENILGVIKSSSPSNLEGIL